MYPDDQRQQSSNSICFPQLLFILPHLHTKPKLNIMLPSPSSPDFPSALRTRRESLGISRSELARKAKIHGVMPRRYEELDCGEFSRPRNDTWVALNIALGYAPPQAESSELESSEAPLIASGTGTQEMVKNVKPLSMADAKAGLALTFGVNIDRIEIVIRG
jgi:transcriptional regulator with XRE-family HTH domain